MPNPKYTNNAYESGLKLQQDDAHRTASLFEMLTKQQRDSEAAQARQSQAEAFDMDKSLKMQDLNQRGHETLQGMEQSGHEKLQSMKQQQAMDMLAKQQAMAQQMAGQYPNRAVNVEGVSIGDKSPKSLQMMLTPAQETAEKMVGKQIADYESAGGRPALEKSVGALQSVAQDLGPNGNRDAYDRTVGSLFGGFPSILGVVGSSEKARRDKAWSTANMLAKQSDPNPTQKQIENIMGQIYDPSSSNEVNAERIGRFTKEQQSKMSQMENAAKRYHTTGYATLEAPGSDPLKQFLKGGSSTATEAPKKPAPGASVEEKQAYLQYLKQQAASKGIQ
jgi:hypothetical protein